MTLALLALAATAVYVVSLYVHPFRPCSRCQGSSRNKGSSRKRFGQCGRCAGTGRRQRIGSRTVHKLVLDLLGEPARQRRIKARNKRHERADHPRYGSSR